MAWTSNPFFHLGCSPSAPTRATVAASRRTNVAGNPLMPLAPLPAAASAAKGIDTPVAAAHRGWGSPLIRRATLSSLPSLLELGMGSGNGGNNANNNGDNDGWGDNNDEDDFSSFLFFFLSSALGCILFQFQFCNAFALATSAGYFIWEVRGGKRTRLISDPSKNAFTAETIPFSFAFSNLWSQCTVLILHMLLPDGFPQSVTPDYLNYSLWRGVQGVASQISAVLATQALLYAVGLGKGAIPAAAAVNWVLKDGVGYLSKILLSKYGRHFDVNPKGWRLFADLLENAAYGMEMLTPAFPHLFVLIGAVAGAGRSAAALIQAATRSCFYAGFAAQRNFAEVIAKGEAQGMVSKSIGIMLGIALANCIGSSTPLVLLSFSVITWVHMFCNLKSYQSIQLRTLNPYRASLVFSEYLFSGQVPPVKEVNDEEPLFPAVPFANIRPAYPDQGEPAVLSYEAKASAAEIERRLQLGSKLSDVVDSKYEVVTLMDLYKDEGYILVERGRQFCVVLKETSSPRDMLKSMFHVNFLYWLERNAGIKGRSTLDDCRPGGRLQISLEYVQREFNHVINDSELVGWVTDSLIARPLPNRVRLSFTECAAAG